MDKDFYTELIYKHKHMDDYGPCVITMHENAWDLTIDDLVHMFTTLMHGATFTNETIDVGFVNYLEDKGYTVVPPSKEEE